MNRKINTFLQGVESAFSLTPSIERHAISQVKIDPRSDKEKVYSDWVKIGLDIKAAASHAQL